MKFVKTSAISALAVAAMLMSAPANAKECKEQAQAACASSDTCSWVKGFTRSDGAKVKAHCRAKPGNGTKKKTSAKKTSTKKKTEDSAAKKTEDTKVKKASNTKKKAKDTASKAKDKAKKKSTAKKKPAKKAKKKAKSS